MYYHVVLINGVLMSARQHISSLYQKRDKTELASYKEHLNKDLEELNVFFEEYLDVFSDEMSAVEDQKAPIWRAYKDKMKQVELIKSDIKLADYYLGML